MDTLLIATWHEGISAIIKIPRGDKEKYSSTSLNFSLLNSVLMKSLAVKIKMLIRNAISIVK